MTRGQPFNARQVAWAAGILEGEGFFTARDLGKRGRPVFVGCKMTDLDVLQRLQHTFWGVGSLKEEPRRNRPAHYKRIWSWRVTNHAEAAAVCAAILGFMLERRRAQVIRLMKLCKAGQRRLVWTTRNGILHRECAACHTVKPHSEFSPSRGRHGSRHGRYAYCKRCHAGRQRIRRRSA